MSLLEDAQAIDGRRVSSCSLCEFIEAQPAERQPEFDELLNSRFTRPSGAEAWTVGHTAAHKILRREGYGSLSEEPVAKHRSRGHRR